MAATLNQSPLYLSLSFFLQAFGQSFLQKDISLFRQNLSSLETLNKKHKLYSKVRPLSLPIHTHPNLPHCSLAYKQPPSLLLTPL